MKNSVKYETIVFSKDRYNNDREKMYAAITKQLMLLMENDYVCKVYDDDTDIIVIQFEHNERKDFWGVSDLVWVTPEEAEMLEANREDNSEKVRLC